MSAILRALPVLVWLAATPAHGQPSAGVPTSRPAPQPDEPGAPASATGPAVHSPRPAPEATSAEYRFDALRIDGTLHGPEAMVIHAAASARRRPLAELRRSFLHRILETLEERCLHVQAGR